MWHDNNQKMVIKYRMRKQKFLRVYLSKIQLELSSAKPEEVLGALLPLTGTWGKAEKVQKQRKELFD